MTSAPTISDLEEHIALIRRNIAELVEQAAAYSGAADDARIADRIAQQEEELAKLLPSKMPVAGRRDGSATATSPTPKGY